MNMRAEAVSQLGAIDRLRALSSRLIHFSSTERLIQADECLIAIERISERMVSEIYQMKKSSTLPEAVIDNLAELLVYVDAMADKFGVTLADLISINEREFPEPSIKPEVIHYPTPEQINAYLDGVPVGRIEEYLRGTLLAKSAPPADPGPSPRAVAAFMAGVPHEQFDEDGDFDSDFCDPENEPERAFDSPMSESDFHPQRMETTTPVPDYENLPVFYVLNLPDKCIVYTEGEFARGDGPEKKWGLAFTRIRARDADHALKIAEQMR